MTSDDEPKPRVSPLSVLDKMKIVNIMCEATSYFIQPNYAEEAIRALYAEGYVIVHPDDVPERLNEGAEQSWLRGWNSCRTHIFGDA